MYNNWTAAAAAFLSSFTDPLLVNTFTGFRYSIARHPQTKKIWTSLRKDPQLGGSSGVSRYHLLRATPMLLPNGSTPTLFQWTARGGLGTDGNTLCTGQLEASQSFHELIQPRPRNAHTYIACNCLGFAIYNYNTGSALIAYGLSAKQALAAGILSPIVLVTMCILCGVSLGRGQLRPNGPFLPWRALLLTVHFDSGLAVLITLPTPWSVD